MEKVESILTAYNRTHSFTEAAQEEDVDERVVRKYVERRRELAANSTQPASAIISSKISAAPVEQKKIDERSFEEIEAAGFVLCEQDRGPVDLVMKLKIKGQLANRVFEDYLTSKNKGEIAKILQEIGKKADQFKILFDHMQEEKMDVGAYVETLKLVPVFRTLKQEVSELEKTIHRQKETASREALEHKGRMERCAEMEKASVDEFIKAAEKSDSLLRACESAELKLKSLHYQIATVENDKFVPLVKAQLAKAVADIEILISEALMCVIDTLKKHPRSQILITQMSPETLKGLGSEQVEEVKKVIREEAASLYGEFCIRLVAKINPLLAIQPNANPETGSTIGTNEPYSSAGNKTMP